ncbi:PTPA-CTERM sorting domain-containing protein [Stenomitos frigidus]|uniref:PEP-CTERM sorting domain-containing protein n=1 Tax=Stenomitos frigidus ULC18 TaxID=2107698 RepID=A0A2T1ES52_9CYAN|nr:PTPA-CTERM sorting domain-containing protein [Stenomitos frigidus]PSB35559.1 hypothetical protein C7B82_00755 [Stenomitos frigidus ULC18]
MTLKLKALMTVAAIGTTAAFVTHVTPASAAALTWNLNAQFVDGGTAKGSFNYDAATGVLSQFDVTTFVGTSSPSNLFFPGTTFSSPSSTGSLQSATRLELINSDRFLKALFDAPLTDAGGTIAMVSAFSFEKLGFPNGLGVTRDVASGSVTATAVPTPALLPGLIGLGVGALRQKRKAAQAQALS